MALWQRAGAGGRPEGFVGMSLKVAVITPYVGEPAWMLRQAHESVLAQTYPCSHVLVADGAIRPEFDGWEAMHLGLSRPQRDFGSTPRFVGSAHAIFLGFDMVAFLDADNWYRQDHIATMVALHEHTGASFLTCGRWLAALDGEVMAKCPITNPDRFVDVSCMVYTREAFPLLTYWACMPDYAHEISDRVVLQHHIAAGARRAHSPEPTVYYRCGKAGAYRMLGREVPPGVAPAPDYGAVFARWAAEGRPPLI